MSKNFEVNTKLDFLTYVRIVDSIVEEFFDLDGEYCPHIGKAYAMKLFYDNCVTSKELNEKITADMDNITVVNILANDRDFMRAFNDAVSPFVADCAFDFLNAYNDAMNIVDDRKSSMVRVANVVKGALQEIVEKIAPALTEETLEAAKVISANMTGGVSTAEAVVKQYVKSPMLKKILNTKTDNLAAEK